MRGPEHCPRNCWCRDTRPVKLRYATEERVGGPSGPRLPCEGAAPTLTQHHTSPSSQRRTTTPRMPRGTASCARAPERDGNTVTPPPPGSHSRLALGGPPALSSDWLRPPLRRLPEGGGWEEKQYGDGERRGAHGDDGG